MRLVASYGALRIMVQYTAQKKNTWYYRRRIPKDILKLDPEYRGRKAWTLYFSLKTSDMIEASRKAQRHTKKLEAHWAALRAKYRGRVPSAMKQSDAIKELAKQGLTKKAIAERLQVSERSVYRALN